MTWNPGEECLAHLPLSVLEKPTGVLMLGCGTGGAFRALREYPLVRNVVAVVPSLSVETALRRSFPAGPQALASRGGEGSLEFRHGDLRRFLRSESTRWSIILSHLAWCAGPEAKARAASVSHFGLVRKRLSRNGLFCMGLSTDLSPASLRAILLNFHEVFPAGQLWFSLPSQILLLGSPGEVAVSLAALEERLARPDFLAVFSELHLGSVEAILGSRVCGIEDAVRTVTGEVGPEPGLPQLRQNFRQLELGNGSLRHRKANLLFLAERVDPNPFPVQTEDSSLSERLVKATVALKVLLQATASATQSEGVEVAEEMLREAAEQSPDDPRLAAALAGELAGARAAMFPDAASVARRAEDLVSRPEPGRNGDPPPAHGTAQSTSTPIRPRPATSDDTEWKKYVTFGEMSWRSGDFSRALKAFRTAEKLAPGEVAPAFNVAMVLSNLGRHSEAEERYRMLLEWQPDHVEARINLAYCLACQDKLAEAEKVNRAVLKEHPKSHVAHYNLATLLKRSGRIEDAFDEYQAAIDSKADYAEALFDYAVLLYEQEEYYPAVKHFKEFMRLMPTSPQAAKARRILKELGKKRIGR